MSEVTANSMKRILLLVCVAIFTIGPTSRVYSAMQEPFVTDDVMTGQVRIGPGQCKMFQFEVDANRMRTARIVGRFEAAGGGGNDIEVVIAEQDEFLNWFSNHGGKIIYNSGKRTTGTLDVQISSSGTYVVAFSNKFSAISAKTVSGNILIAYLPTGR